MEPRDIQVGKYYLLVDINQSYVVYTEEKRLSALGEDLFIKYWLLSWPRPHNQGQVKYTLNQKSWVSDNLVKIISREKAQILVGTYGYSTSDLPVTL